MQSKRTVESATIWRATDPNYPDVPQPPPPEVVARSTSRSTVDYDTYVLRYTGQQRRHTLLFTAGIVGAILSAFYLTGVALIIAAAIAIGLAFTGAVGFVIAANAHGSYTRDLAISTSETYERPPSPPQPQTVRPFVASGNPGRRTTNTGRLQFEPQVWQSLFNLALANGGTVDKENVCRKAGIGRRWYHTDPNSADGYRAFQAELRNIGFIDQRNRLTDTALAWYAAQIPLPLDALPTRTPVDRPTAVRPPSDRDGEGEWGEWGE